MKKKFSLKNLDCANCAAKMEDAIRKLDGVNDASVIFMTQKLVVDADEARFEEIMDKAAAICRRINPDCSIERGNAERNGEPEYV